MWYTVPVGWSLVLRVDPNKQQQSASQISRYLRDFYRNIPLSPSSPACTWTCFLVCGKKDSPPPSLHLGVCTIHWLADRLVTWLIDCYQQVGVNNPNRSRTQTLSKFTGIRNYHCQNQFIIPFTHRAGGRVKILNLSWIHLLCIFLVSQVALYFLQLFYMLSLLWRIRSSDRNCLVLQSPSLG